MFWLGVVRDRPDVVRVGIVVDGIIGVDGRGIIVDGIIVVGIIVVVAVHIDIGVVIHIHIGVVLFAIAFALSRDIHLLDGRLLALLYRHVVVLGAHLDSERRLELTC